MRNTNNIRRLLAGTIILSGVALATSIALKMNRNKEVSPKPVAQSPAADLSLQKIHYMETRKGKKAWDLFADKAEFDKDSDTTRLSNIRFIVAGDKKTGNIELLADKAEYVKESGDVTLTGRVRANTDSGIEFSTSAVSYEAARSRISTSSPVSFSSGMLDVDGIGMEVSTDRRKIKINSRVRAIFTPEKAGLP